MNIKDRIIKSLGDYIDSHREKNIKEVEKLSISGHTRGVITNSDNSYIKKVSKYKQDGMISVDTLLKNVFTDSHSGNIYFNDNSNVITLHNVLNDTYVESRKDFFEMASEKVFIICSSRQSFQAFKDYVLNNNKYNSFYNETEEILDKKAFETSFNVIKKDELKEEKIDKEKSNDKEVDITKNQVSLNGEISKIGKRFTKKDGEKGLFIEVSQEYEYKGKQQKNIIPIMLEKNILDEYSSRIKLGDSISLTGTINSYTDKDNKFHTYIKGLELDILNRIKDKGAEMQ